MKNLSGLRPLGRAVLVEPYEPEVKVGRIVLPPAAKERMTSAEQRATVIAVGPEAWSDEAEPRAIPGDKVMISAYAGAMCVGPLDGKQYRVINCNDIFLQIEHEITETVVDMPQDSDKMETV